MSRLDVTERCAALRSCDGDRAQGERARLRGVGRRGGVLAWEAPAVAAPIAAATETAMTTRVAPLRLFDLLMGVPPWDGAWSVRT
ncbi:hypothetical protein GCM10020221_14150 [Streptomyces thioluteus]|uniref:Uncharacterized protein n=1 Tax=Streptomyces thioluteus TaxID=66431 RepID=A0ABN3WJS6_STRTU